LRPAVAVVAALALAACAASEPLPDLMPGERPALHTDEAGLWMATDRAEERLKSSGARLRDPALEGYLHGIACKLSPDHCHSVRIYVIEQPHFNASIMPNGAMQVWTGMLLRVDSEDQLALVIGHELAHFERRHTLQQWRAIRSRAALAEVAGTLGGTPGSLLASSALLMSTMAYSREQEREADALGIARLPEAGYDAKEAARVWQLVLDEQQVSDQPEGFVFLATHPTPADRLQTLQALAAQQPTAARPQPGDASGLAELIAPHRLTWLRAELRRQKPPETEWLFERLLSRTPHDPELLFSRGELRRLRGGPGDLEGAVADYRAAVGHPDAPVAAWRSLGTALAQLGRKGEARTAFATYLALAPDAPDRALVEATLQEMS
jgi:beta-barrel assembly-enhancing protease